MQAAVRGKHTRTEANEDPKETNRSPKEKEPRPHTTSFGEVSSERLFRRAFGKGGTLGEGRLLADPTCVSEEPGGYKEALPETSRADSQVGEEVGDLQQFFAETNPKGSTKLPTKRPIEEHCSRNDDRS